MPDLATWEAFFDSATLLSAMGVDARCTDIVEFGCGYGTFTLAAARMVSGTVYALDIDPAMLDTVHARAEAAGLGNIDLRMRDFTSRGSGLPDGCADYAMVFNILHGDAPVALLREAHRILRANGQLGIVHWNHDATTPRGPPLSIRPRPGQCRAWAATAGFLEPGAPVDLPPYHYGLRCRKVAER